MIMYHMRDCIILNSYSEIKDTSVTLLKNNKKMGLYHHYWQSKVTR